jgi:hypothetical protein
MKDTIKLSVEDSLKSERMLDRIKAVELHVNRSAGHYPVPGRVEGVSAQAVT